MNVQFSLDASTQPLLAVFVNADNMTDVLSEPVFSTELVQWVKDADFTGKDGSSVTMPNAALVNAALLKLSSLLVEQTREPLLVVWDISLRRKVSLASRSSTLQTLNWLSHNVYWVIQVRTL